MVPFNVKMEGATSEIVQWQGLQGENHYLHVSIHETLPNWLRFGILERLLYPCTRSGSLVANFSQGLGDGLAG